MTALPLARLRARLAGELDDSSRRRAEYATDASNYRVPPTAVVFPRSADDVAETLAFAAEHGSSVTARGGGTSMAGNAVGPGLVLDYSRHLNRIVSIDAATRLAVVQPGVVLADLQRAAGRSGLRFGPDPSSQDRCTLGGMIGNNACGPRAVAWGRTGENLRELDILDGSGTRRRLAAGLDPVPGLADFVRANLALLRTEFGRFSRQASGYSLEHLLPERGSDLAAAFAGTEGTCGLLLTATVELVPVPAATGFVAFGYPDMAAAAEAAAHLVAARPLALEGLDARLVDVVRRHRGGVPELPAGGGWLFVETAGADQAGADARAAELAAGHDAPARVVTDPAEVSALWRIRADGAGLAGRTPDGAPAWPGWEDAAVPVHRLGTYLREFAELTAAHGVDGLLYGHFGDGCVHVRLDFPLADAPHRFRAFLFDAAALVARHGGSLSGEHGDGRARSELLPAMYSPAALAAFAGFKALFDPADRLNPGVLVAPAAVDADLRPARAGAPVPARGFALLVDAGDLSRAVHRCTGIGRCRADTGFMCPSYQATRDETDSTRGRARVLQEVVTGGSLTPGGWASAELADSLEWCLSCKACAAECPAGVDLATYKSEALYRRYQGRRRPISHYTLGRLPWWLRLASRAPRLVNVAAGRPGLRRFAMARAGLDPGRPVPALAGTSFRRHRSRPADAADVLLWVDTFTDAFAPEIAAAAVELIESVGGRVRVSEPGLCCGLTWITTGQLDGARRRLRSTLDALAGHVRSGGLVVGLEPSCTAVLRAELPELLGDDPRAGAIAAATRTLAEFLTERPLPALPQLAGTAVVVQPHCHQHAVFGFGPDRALLAATGAQVVELTGCCGMAGNFGMERGHLRLSTAIAERALLPALRARPDALFVADGFSCRTQARQLGGRTGRHLAQLLRGPDRDGQLPNGRTPGGTS
ncbi:FAD-binding and (Fe-S)-binding domain-containing protein [Skermania piniformis]